VAEIQDRDSFKRQSFSHYYSLVRI
jgi:hypothetical protein